MLCSLKIFLFCALSFGNGNADLAIVASASGESVEVLPPYSQCKLPDLPMDRTGLSQNGLVLCGGGYVQNTRRTCTKLEKNGWTNTYYLDNDDYKGHTSWTVPQTGDIMLVGGERNASKTAIRIDTDGTVHEAFPLKYGRKDACSIGLEDSFILTGGQDMESENKVTEYTWNQGHVRDLPNLNTGRMQHGCASYFDSGSRVLLVTGGQSYHQGVLKELSSTEIMRDGDWFWTTAFELPSPRNALVGYTLNNVVYMTGGNLGYEAGYKDLDDILIFDARTSTWSMFDHMKSPRSGHALGMVPWTDLQHLCSGTSGNIIEFPSSSPSIVSTTKPFLEFPSSSPSIVSTTNPSSMESNFEMLLLVASAPMIILGLII